MVSLRSFSVSHFSYAQMESCRRQSNVVLLCQEWDLLCALFYVYRFISNPELRATSVYQMVAVLIRSHQLVTSARRIASVKGALTTVTAFVSEIQKQR